MNKGNVFVKHGARVMLVLLMVLMLSALFTHSALAQGTDPVPPGEVTPVDVTNLVALLAFLVTPAGLLSWAMYWSNFLRGLREDPEDKAAPLLQGIAHFMHNCSAATTQFIHMLGSFLVPAVAKFIYDTVPPEKLALAQPTFAFVALLFLTYLGGQLWYAYRKDKTQPVASVVQETSPSGAQRTTAQVGGEPVAAGFSTPKA